MKSRLHFIIVLVILVGFCLAVWQIGQIYIRTLIHPGSNHSTVIGNELRTLSLQGLDFWTLQAGVYANAGNAGLAKDRLRQLGFPAITVAGNSTVVAVGMGVTADSLASLRQTMQRAGIEVIPKHFVWPSESFRVNGAQSDQVIDLLSGVNEILTGPLKDEAVSRLLTVWEQGDGTWRSNAELTTLYNVLVQTRAEYTQESEPALRMQLFGAYRDAINNLRAGKNG